MAFTVLEIIDGKTIRVSPNWDWNQQRGDRVYINGYNIANIPNGLEFAKNKLTALILNKLVELKNPILIQGQTGIISCDVFLNGVNIARYFPEFQPK